jgi:hypothetical protein
MDARGARLLHDAEVLNEVRDIVGAARVLAEVLERTERKAVMDPAPFRRTGGSSIGAKHAGVVGHGPAADEDAVDDGVGARHEPQADRQHQHGRRAESGRAPHQPQRVSRVLREIAWHVRKTGRPRAHLQCSRDRSEHLPVVPPARGPGQSLALYALELFVEM